MKKNILIVILSFLAINSFSQGTNKKTQFYSIFTHDAVLEKEEVILENDLFLVDYNTVSENEPKKETFKLNYTVDENGKITFIKGQKGFNKDSAKTDTSDELINKLNALVTYIKVVHITTKKEESTGNMFREKHPDCKKLKNVIFYGTIKINKLTKKS